MARKTQTEVDNTYSTYVRKSSCVNDVKRLIESMHQPEVNNNESNF